MGVKYKIDECGLKSRWGENIEYYINSINNTEGLEEYNIELYGYENHNVAGEVIFPNRVFTYSSDYFNVRIVFKINDLTIGHSTISCFPNCCGVAIITADYRQFNNYHGDMYKLPDGKISPHIGQLNLLTTMLLANKVGKYPSSIAIERQDSKNFEFYENIGWKIEGECKGKSGNTLIHLAQDLKEKDWLEEIYKLYGQKNIDKKQASKPQTTKKLVTLDEE